MLQIFYNGYGRIYTRRHRPDSISEYQLISIKLFKKHTLNFCFGSKMTPLPSLELFQNSSDLVAGPFPIQCYSVVYSAVLPPSLMVFFNIGYKSLVYYGILLGELFCSHSLHLGRLICLIPTDFNP